MRDCKSVKSLDVAFAGALAISSSTRSRSSRMSTTWPSPDCSADWRMTRLAATRSPARCCSTREDVGAVGLGVGELDEHHLRAIEVIADRGLQHALGLEFGDDRGRRGRDSRIATGETAGHERRDDKGGHAAGRAPTAGTRRIGAHSRLPFAFRSSAGSRRAHAVRSNPIGASTGAAESTSVMTRRSWSCANWHSPHDARCESTRARSARSVSP